MRNSGLRRAATVAVVVATATALGGALALAVSGGTPVPDGTFAFAAKVNVNDQAGCTAALVAPRWVITSSSCFSVNGQPVATGAPTTPARVSIGPDDKAATLTVTYLVPRTERDVVLAQLSSAVANVTPIAIDTAAPAVGSTLNVAGAGRTDTEWVPARLHAANYTVQATDATTISLAAAAGAADPCKGDAGGPAVATVNGQPELVGITSRSWQHGCLDVNETRSGATETRVDDLASWIQAQTTPLMADPTKIQFADLDGDGKAELLAYFPDGTVRARHNNNGFSSAPWGTDDIVVAVEFPADRSHFADLDGDGRAEAIRDYDNGDVHAWHNGKGFTTMPWDGGDQIVGVGFNDPSRLMFTDLDGDRKSEILKINDDNSVTAWHNIKGFAEMPWDGGSVTVAVDFKPGQCWFTDLDGDGRAEALRVMADGTVHAWHNIKGFTTMPWDGGDQQVATGFPNPATLKFADLDGDHRSDAVAVDPNYQLRAWHNGAGFANMPWDNVVTISVPTLP
ncbi:trypsin-like serine protease [Kutzneria kofuensis]|uniref:Putative Zn-binding protein involved in type VI secretion n=1 Tax=Kutzneria kofuensis TaxID=103725 RepID=A0A7W9NLF0_9PSEU|nr:trypsin-like serine protease [Kutzneria kofuensis]MBB5896228.1 putative Zn-binding protein involved in type VI secretion [Kutzneria kofuensis]